jgi:catechol 2,3-dioxygenase-like lactoylglutathione lyase family enzyme
MITALDHIVLLVRDIDAAVAGYRALLGRAPAWRAERDGVATAIFALANTALELMAPMGDGDGAKPVRAALEAQGEGLASLAFAVGDIEQARHRLSRLGLAPSEVSEGDSRDLGSGRTMRWRRIRAATEASGGVRMFFLERAEPLAPSPAVTEAPVDGLDHIVIATPDPERAAALYGARLGLDMKLDRTIAAFDTRFLFFRCGGTVVEIVHRLKDGRSDGSDVLRGVTWATADLAAAHARLRQAGCELSEMRDGRKPGTRVFTVRTGAFGVPTLMIQQGAR